MMTFISENTVHLSRLSSIETQRKCARQCDVNGGKLFSVLTDRVSRAVYNILYKNNNNGRSLNRQTAASFVFPMMHQVLSPTFPNSAPQLVIALAKLTSLFQDVIIRLSQRQSRRCSPVCDHSTQY